MENNKYNIYNYELSFDKPCAELSLLKLCHGEKECHEMEQLRGDTWLSGQYYAGNASSCVSKAKRCKCCFSTSNLRLARASKRQCPGEALLLVVKVV